MHNFKIIIKHKLKHKKALLIHTTMVQKAVQNYISGILNTALTYSPLYAVTFSYLHIIF